MFEETKSLLTGFSPVKLMGVVTSVRGLMVTCGGLDSFMSIGSRCKVYKKSLSHDASPFVICEVIGFDGDDALLMPFDSVEGIGPGCKVEVMEGGATIRPHASWLGRVLDSFGNPIDGKGPVQMGDKAVPIMNTPPPSHQRGRVEGKLDLGVRPLNTFLTCCHGQRLGIFAGSGVGKSIMMSMLAKFSTSSVNVIGLIGERGREVKEFIEDDLGEEGLARSVVIVSTSAESALMRRLAAYTTMSVSEYFRDEGKDVLCMMDSVTRFAMAQREIGLSVGEPPTSKGYTPTVFAELPKLLERAGPGLKGSGSITGLFTVLVEGGDTDEPVADAVRGILDGHVILERHIAEHGRYPAINILKSVSRMLPDCNTDMENKLIKAARQLMAAYDDMEEMIRLGAYRRGSDPNVDRAIHFHPALEAFLGQGMHEQSRLDEGYRDLAAILGIAEWPPAEGTDPFDPNAGQPQQGQPQAGGPIPLRRNK